MSNKTLMTTEQLTQSVEAALDDLKARDIQTHDVSELTDITDVMVIATGTSDTHVRASANSVIQQLKDKGEAPVHIEGLDSKPIDWVLVDYGSVVVHVMREDARDFYDLDGFWGGAIDRVERSRDESWNLN